MRHGQKSLIAQWKPIQWIESGKWLTSYCWEPESFDESSNEQVVRVLGEGLADALSFAYNQQSYWNVHLKKNERIYLLQKAESGPFG